MNDDRLISLNAAKDYIDSQKGRPFIGCTIGEAMKIMLDEVSSAQPPKEIPKRVLWSGWKGYRDTRYKCPNCEKPVRNDDTYCHRCGQRLMFPHISFTDYVPGEKQDVIVRWDDEG